MVEYHYPLFLRIGAVFAFFVSLLLAVLTWLAYRQDGMTSGPYILPLWLAMAGYWVYTFVTMPGLVRFEHDRLVIHHWLWTRTLLYTEMDAVRFTPWGLLIRTPDQSALLSRAHPNVCAAIYGELEQRAPVAQAIFQQRFAAFPIVLMARRVGPIAFFVFGPLLIFLAIMGLNHILTSVTPLGEKIGVAIFILIGAAMGVGLLYGVIFRYVWRYTFTAERVQARYTLRTRQWDAAEIGAIELFSETSSHRGAERTRWWMEIQFANGQTLSVSPSQWGAWLGNSDVGEELLLRQLRDRLRLLYSLPSSPIPSVL